MKSSNNTPKILEGITFDDVLLVPTVSRVLSRNDTDTSTYLTKA